MTSNKMYGGRWKVINVLGEGGQSRVFRVSDESGRCPGTYALKRVLNARRPDRFAKEVDAGTRLQHEHIVPIVDHNLGAADAEREGSFLVMPLAEGKDLSKRRGLYKESLDTTLKVARQLCEALAHAHAAGVLHRDVKPENVLFKEQDAHNVWLADFGICLVADEQRYTQVDERVGPAYFMAPELERGGRLDVTPAADIYSLGKVIYYMISGGIVIARESLDENLALWAEGPRYQLLKLLLMRMICDVRVRLQTVSEVDREIARIQSWETVVGAAAVGAGALNALSRIKENALKARSIKESNALWRQLEAEALSAVSKGVIALVANQLRGIREALHDPEFLTFEVLEASADAPKDVVTSDERGWRTVDCCECRIQLPTNPFREIHVLRFGVLHSIAHSAHVDSVHLQPQRDVQLIFLPMYSEYLPGHKLPRHGVGAQRSPREATRVTTKGADSYVTLRLSEWPTVADKVAVLVRECVDALVTQLAKRGR